MGTAKLRDSFLETYFPLDTAESPQNLLQARQASIALLNTDTVWRMCRTVQFPPVSNINSKLRIFVST